MIDGDRDDVVTEASVLGGLTVSDLIVDYPPGVEVVDLSGLIDTLLNAPADQLSAEAAPVVADAGTEAGQIISAAGESVLDLAGLSGIGHTITILYDETPTI